MEREFIAPNAARLRVVSFEFPVEEQYRVSTRVQGKKAKIDSRVFTRHAEAIEAQLAEVGQRLAEGYIEAPPWLTYINDGERLAIRPPIIPLLETRKGEKVTRSKFKSLSDALAAYNKKVALWTRKKFRFELPSWESALGLPNAAFEEATEMNGDQLDRRFFHRRGVPSDEFGAERRYEQGTLRRMNFQVNAQREGPCFEVESNRLVTMTHYHRDGLRGPGITFNADGTILHFGVYDEEGGQRDLHVFKDGELHSTAPRGLTPQEKKTGVWTTYKPARRETLWDEGQQKIVKSFCRYSGNLTHEQHFDEAGELCEEREWTSAGELYGEKFWQGGARVGTWTEPDSDQELRITHYVGPDRMDWIGWRRPDGTLNHRQEYDESGQKIRILEYDEKEVLDTVVARNPTGEWMLTQVYPGTDDKLRVGPVDDDLCPHGVFTLFAPNGKETGTEEWVHGASVRQAIDDLFACVEGGAYVPAPFLGESLVSIEHTTFTDLSVPGTLEDHLARLFLFARDHLDALRPPTAEAKQKWVHRSTGGTCLVLKLSRNKLREIGVLRPDESLAARAKSKAVKDMYTLGGIDVELFHPDGSSLCRWGRYHWGDIAVTSAWREGPWQEQNAKGQHTRTQTFERYRIYEDQRHAQFDAGGASQGDVNEQTAQALEASKKPPSRAHFWELCRAVEQLATADEAGLLGVLPELVAAVGSWPDEVRMAPLLWVNRLVTGALPNATLGLVSGISLSAAVVHGESASPFYQRMVDWLSRYPQDGPAPRGISLSCRAPVTRALLQAMAETATESQFHPPISEEDMDGTAGLDPTHYPAIFGSGLLRDVEILDVSMEETPWNIEDEVQYVFAGRGLCLADVVTHLESARLRVLNLHGQSAKPKGQLGAPRVLKSAKAKLERLETLDVGGGHALGNAQIKSLVSHCPALKELSLYSGQAIAELLACESYESLIHGEEVNYVRSLEDLWGIGKQGDIDAMRIGPSGWKALSGVAHVVVSKAQAIGAPSSVNVTPGKTWEDREVARFERYFEHP